MGTLIAQNILEKFLIIQNIDNSNKWIDADGAFLKGNF